MELVGLGRMESSDGFVRDMTERELTHPTDNTGYWTKGLPPIYSPSP